MKDRYDYLIVGQGLAGICMSHRLLKEGKKILVVDSKRHTPASTVAAGIINPITGRRYVKSWMFDELLQEADRFYIELQEQLGLWVDDHAEAIDVVFHKGAIGETYNIGGNNEWKNIDLVELLCDTMDQLLDREVGSSRSLIRFVKDRPGHDRRYAIDASKIKDELGWEPKIQMQEGLLATAKWYLEQEEWMNRILSGAYKEYYSKQYNS